MYASSVWSLALILTASLSWLYRVLYLQLDYGQIPLITACVFSYDVQQLVASFLITNPLNALLLVHFRSINEILIESIPAQDRQVALSILGASTLMHQLWCQLFPCLYKVSNSREIMGNDGSSQWRDNVVGQTPGYRFTTVDTRGRSCQRQQLEIPSSTSKKDEIKPGSGRGVGKWDCTTEIGRLSARETQHFPRDVIGECLLTKNASASLVHEYKRSQKFRTVAANPMISQTFFSAEEKMSGQSMNDLQCSRQEMARDRVADFSTGTPSAQQEVTSSLIDP